MENFTQELIAKARAAKSPEELMELAKANGIELTAEEAKTYFEQLNASGAISDDDLEAVTGGGVCSVIEDFFRARRQFHESACPNCGDETTTTDDQSKPVFDGTIMPLPAKSNVPTQDNNNNKIDYL